MANGSHLSPDFVGYDVGVPSGGAPANAGFVGLLDFTGYPVGLPSVTPPAPTPTGNPRGGGTIINVYMKGQSREDRKRKREDEEILILGRKRV